MNILGSETRPLIREINADLDINKSRLGSC